MYLYAITFGDARIVKIGMTNDLARRLRELQTGSSHPLRIAHSRYIGPAAHMAERAIHDYITPLRTGSDGEWFILSDLDATLLINVYGYIFSNIFSTEVSMKIMNQKCFQIVWDHRELITDRDNADLCDDTDDEDDSYPIPDIWKIFGGTLVRPRPERAPISLERYLESSDLGRMISFTQKLLELPNISDEFSSIYTIEQKMLEMTDARFNGSAFTLYLSWQISRALTKNEILELVSLWNIFSKSFNDVEQNGEQWPKRGVDDHIDQFCTWTGIDRKISQSYLYFSSEKCTAILKLNRGQSASGKSHYMTLEEVNPKHIEWGLLTPNLPQNIYDEPFREWMHSAILEADKEFGIFISRSTHIFPHRRPYDGPQPAASPVESLIDPAEWLTDPNSDTSDREMWLQRRLDKMFIDQLRGR